MEQECNHLRQRNDTLSQQFAQLQQEMMNSVQDKNTTISDLKAEVKMKSFELTNLGVTFEVNYAMAACCNCTVNTVAKS